MKSDRASGRNGHESSGKFWAVSVFVSVWVAASTASTQTAAAFVEPGVGGWRTGVLAFGKERRLPPPPDSQATATELQELRSLAAQRDAAALERIRYWDFASPFYRWNEMLIDIAAANPWPGGLSTRAFALMNVAIYDSPVATWDSKYAVVSAPDGVDVDYPPAGR